MKKNLILVVLFFNLSAIGFSQNGIYGGGFESWKRVDKLPNSHYYEPDSSWFSTLNILDTIPTPPGITVYPCDTTHNGSRHSARLVTRKIDLLDIVIPGVIGTIKINWATSAAILGMPYPYGDSLPRDFSGFYQSFPLDNDSAGAAILLSKWNNVTKKRDTIAHNRLVFHGTVSAFTEFNTPITYFNTTLKPDSLTVLLLSCAGFNAANMFGSVGTVGSQAIFDDVSLSGVNGFPFTLMPTVGLTLYPNPATDQVHVELAREIGDAFFEIWDGTGRLLKQYLFRTKSLVANVSDLTPGVYYYKVRQGSKNMNSGTFVVSR